MLEQVFFNLFDNAAKYSPDGSEIVVSVCVADERIAVSIADRGEGIPPFVEEKIFEKFYRFARGDSAPPGTGLGLMICRGFLAIMQGSISATNRVEGPGAVFTVSLPRAPH
jgi:two-component system sensor histidine kinase KdpD